MQIDHVVIAVGNLDDATAVMEQRYGLTALPGGRHPGWGTANRIVPLGNAYLELAAVVDAGEAATNPFGTWVAAMADAGTGMGWAVRTDDISAVATRLGLDVSPGRRARPDGSLAEWLIAGVGEAAARPWLPFFIQWGAHTSLPGATQVIHGTGEVSLSGLRVEGDSNELREWLGGSAVPAFVEPGVRGVTGVELATSAGKRIFATSRGR